MAPSKKVVGKGLRRKTTKKKMTLERSEDKKESIFIGGPAEVSDNELEVNSERSALSGIWDVDTLSSMENNLIWKRCKCCDKVLMYAIKNGNYDLVSMVLEENLNYGGVKKKVLEIAVTDGYNDIALLLVEKGADIGDKIWGHVMKYAVEKNRDDIVSILLKQGREIFDLNRQAGEEALRMAMDRRYRCSSDIVVMLLEHKVGVTGEYGEAVLNWCGEPSDLIIVKRLIDAGVNVRGVFGGKALVLGAKWGRADIVSRLLKRGVDVMGEYGERSLQTAWDYYNLWELKNPTRPGGPGRRGFENKAPPEGIFRDIVSMIQEYRLRSYRDHRQIVVGRENNMQQAWISKWIWSIVTKVRDITGNEVTYQSTSLDHLKCQLASRLNTYCSCMSIVDLNGKVVKEDFWTRRDDHRSTSDVPIWMAINDTSVPEEMSKWRYRDWRDRMCTCIFNEPYSIFDAMKEYRSIVTKVRDITGNEVTYQSASLDHLKCQLASRLNAYCSCVSIVDLNGKVVKEDFWTRRDDHRSTSDVPIWMAINDTSVPEEMSKWRFCLGRRDCMLTCVCNESYSIFDAMKELVSTENFDTIVKYEFALAQCAGNKKLELKMEKYMRSLYTYAPFPVGKE